MFSNNVNSEGPSSYVNSNAVVDGNPKDLEEIFCIAQSLASKTSSPIEQEQAIEYYVLAAQQGHIESIYTLIKKYKKR
jgi:hypothetical protein